MTIFALATGLRKSNVAGLEWDRIDLERRCCYIPGYLSKSGQRIPVPLNDDAVAVLERWQHIRQTHGGQWSATVRRYVFVYRRRAPIQKLTTRMWRQCKAAGLEGVTFHSMRHAWASWQMQAKTPLRIQQELGGWANLDMPLRYAHLDPGHLADYADRSLLGPDNRRKSVRLETAELDHPTQHIDFDGKGGTRTLDPGIMRHRGRNNTNILMHLRELALCDVLPGGGRRLDFPLSFSPNLLMPWFELRHLEAAVCARHT